MKHFCPDKKKRFSLVELPCITDKEYVCGIRDGKLGSIVGCKLWMAMRPCKEGICPVE